MQARPPSRQRRFLGVLALLAFARLAFAQTPSAWLMGSNGVGQLGSVLATHSSTPVTLDTGVSSAAVGSAHTLYLKADSTLWALGGNSDGQLGLGDTVDRSTAVQIATGVSSVAAGSNHTLFIKTDATLWAVGDNTYGQLGTGDTADRVSPVQIAVDVASIGAGDDCTLFIKTDGSLWSVGRNHEGQLGDGTITDRLSPAQISTAVSSACGGIAHTLFIKTDGSLWGCGRNTERQLGLGSTVSRQLTPTQVGTQARSAAAAGHQSLYVKTDNTLRRSGTGASFDQTSTNVTSAALGLWHSLELKTNGALLGLGDNTLRQLGGASAAPISTSLQLDTSVSAVFAREAHSVYLRADGTLLGLGDNRSGQLGSSPSGTVLPIASATPYAAIFHGLAHTLWLKADGTLWASGDNTYGQLGTGDTLPRSSPVQIATGVATAAAGSWHTLFVKTDKTLWACGRNSSGQLGTSSSGTPRLTPVWTQSSVLAVAAGDNHSLIQMIDGSLCGAGDNVHGQLGNGGFSGSLRRITTTNVASFSAAGSHSLYVMGSSLYVLGENSHGQLGTGTTFGTGSIPVIVAGEVAAVSTASQHTLFLKMDGTLWGMGRNASGQLGLADTSSRLLPAQIATNVAAFAAGGLVPDGIRGHSLFAKPDGSLWAMGYNRFGQLGDGTRIDRLAPIQVGERTSAVFAGDLCGGFLQSSMDPPVISTPPASHTVAFAASARLQVAAAGGFLRYQWFKGSSGDTSQPVPGANSSALLTLPMLEPATYWVRVANNTGSADSPAATITPQAPRQATLSGVGRRTNGEFGEGPIRLPNSPVPWTTGFSTVTASGHGHALFLKLDGSLWGVGANSDGQLGLGDGLARSSAVQVSASASAVSTGSTHTLFLRPDGTLWAMGSNANGQLGDGTTTGRGTPVQIADSVSAIATGHDHSLFLKSDGTLWGMGLNASGQLGTGDTTSRSSPVQIAGSVSAIAAQYTRSLFLKTDGSLWGMGGNTFGELGLGDTANRSTPAQIVSSGVNAVAAGYSHSLFLKSDGSLWTMGLNTSGQLGTGDTASRSTPVQLSTRVAAMAAGYSHSLFLKTDGTLWATGENSQGELGVGSYVDQLSAREIAVNVDRIEASGSLSHFVDRAGAHFVMGSGYAENLTLLPTTQPPFLTPVPMAIGVSSALALPGALQPGRPAASQYLTPDGEVWTSRGSSLPAPRFPGFLSLPPIARLLPSSSMLDSTSSLTLSLTEESLFIDREGGLWGRGVNDFGQLGVGGTPFVQEPVFITGGVADASTPNRVTFVLKADLSLWRIGGTGPTAHIPNLIAREVVAFKSSISHTLFLKSDGSLWGFGEGRHSQLGVAATSADLYMTTPLLIAKDVTDFEIGPRQSFFMKNDGSLWACGYNNVSQLGSPSTSNKLPFQVTTGVVKVISRLGNTFLLKSDGSLWAAGMGGNGRLGTGTSTTQTTFVQIATDVSDVFTSPAGDTTVFLKTDRSLWGMGRNDSGQLGLGHNNSTVLTPTLIRSQVYAAAPSGLHTLILHDAASLASPSITAQPTSQTVPFTGYAALSVTASGEGILAYQWYQGAPGDTARPLADANDTTLRFPAFAGTASYWVRVTNAAGSVDSAAATITVTGAGSPAFRSWAIAAGLSGSRLAISADADGDGLANLLEYAFGTSPANASSSTTFAPELVQLPDGEFLVLTHRRRKSTDASIAYERSTNLHTWEPAALAPIVVDPDVDGDGLVEEISVALPLPPDSPRDFLRLKVTSP